MTRRRLALCSAVLVAALVPGGTRALAAPEIAGIAVDTGTLALRCGAVWDAAGGHRRGPIAIVADKGRIVSIQPDGSALRPGETDLRGETCLPGLIDAHTHVMLESDRLEGDYDAQLLKASPEYRTIVGVGHAGRLLQWGFTAVRDLGAEGGGWGDLAVRDAIDRGMVSGPRMQVATQAIVATSAYPLLGYAPGVSVPVGAEQITGADEGRRAVRAQIGRGADVIKLYADRGPRLGADGSVQSVPTLTPDELRAIIGEAHRQGRKAAVNARSAQSARDATDAGADSIEHGDYLDADNIAAMARRGVYYVPDFDTDASISARRAAGGNAVWRAMPQIKCATLARAVRGGVKVAFGSGIGGADWSYNPAAAFAPMAACGMTVAQILTSATLGSARLMGIDDRVGSLEPGKLADVIAVPGEPLSDISVLQRVSFVAKGGVVHRVTGKPVKSGGE
ncbi:imidazolonepropionase-like amidohydrolase [Novosphingobium chloroacetimidivorans]|uniref:Imidazolonepropionase-like amidohydrolase n=1 Tax=Novosphingobium chloroacetimidivorans TaxID=1428314 RepID=A0A7W7NV80_9SPHN|nr:amidohydrolase family protein [Novosphingobium chloroacetimidivorans]MBB4857961.1 imidazolonepropionase-like amidohydrolase [Novosphingobium chloroacetimidivorans]